MKSFFLKANANAQLERAPARDHINVFRAFLRVLERLAPRTPRGAAPFSAGALREKP